MNECSQNTPKKNQASNLFMERFVPEKTHTKGYEADQPRMPTRTRGRMCVLFG